MALTLAQVIAAARHRSPWFHPQRGTPDKVIGDALADYQNELIGQCCLRDKHFLSQTATIVVQLSGADPVTLAGVGADAGLPGNVTDNTIASVPQSAARLVEVGILEEDGATIVMVDAPVSAASSTSVTSTAARVGGAAVVDGDIGRVVAITRGTGAGQARYVLSNTLDTWTISTGSDGLEWATTPDETSVLTLVEPAYATDGSTDIVMAMPATEQRAGYLVRVDALGVPYIDLSAPIVATLDVGVTLPSASGISGGRIRYRDGETENLPIVARSQRETTPGPACYLIANTVYFCGTAEEWADVAQLELEYVPVTPPFTSTADYFLLPDAARPVLVAAAAELLAHRAAELPNAVVDVSDYEAKLAQAEAKYLASLRLSKRSRHQSMRGDGSYS
jgi:hypothetical protein